MSFQWKLSLSCSFSSMISIMMKPFSPVWIIQFTLLKDRANTRCDLQLQQSVAQDVMGIQQWMRHQFAEFSAACTQHAKTKQGISKAKQGKFI